MIPENIVHSLTLPDAGTELYEFVRERLVLFNEEQRKAVLHFWNIWNNAMRKILRIYVWAVGIRLLHAGRLKDGADLLLTKYKIYEQ